MKVCRQDLIKKIINEGENFKPIFINSDGGISNTKTGLQLIGYIEQAVKPVRESETWTDEVVLELLEELKTTEKHDVYAKFLQDVKNKTLDDEGENGLYKSLIKFGKINKFETYDQIPDKIVKLALDFAFELTDEKFSPRVPTLKPLENVDSLRLNYHSHPGWKYYQLSQKLNPNDPLENNKKGIWDKKIREDAMSLKDDWQTARKHEPIHFMIKNSKNKDTKEKTGPKKTRLIAIPEAHYALCAKFIMDPLENELKNRPWLPWASGTSGNDAAIYQKQFLESKCEIEDNPAFNLNEKWVMLDYKSYDSSIDKWVIDKMYESIKSYFDFGRDKQKWFNFIDKMKLNFVNAKFIMPDGLVFQKLRGVTSGASETTYINTRINYFYINFGVVLQQLRIKNAKAVMKIDRPRLVAVTVHGDDCMS